MGRICHLGLKSRDAFGKTSLVTLQYILNVIGMIDQVDTPRANPELRQVAIFIGQVAQEIERVLPISPQLPGRERTGAGKEKLGIHD